jgi:hypothetical protein
MVAQNTAPLAQQQQRCGDDADRAGTDAGQCSDSENLHHGHVNVHEDEDKRREEIRSQEERERIIEDMVKDVVKELRAR